MEAKTVESASITFITGGVRSGKSSFAEKIAMDMASQTNGTLHYIATAQSTDHEMEQRIKKHRRDRQESGYVWKTWEIENNVGTLSSQFVKKDIILLDCLTTWLSNELFAYETDDIGIELHKKKVFQTILDGLLALQENSQHLILVSNEVLHEPIYPSELVMTYCELLGKLHQKLVARAEKAYLVEGGIPLLMKGGKE